jgi:hypothetical protein
MAMTKQQLEKKVKADPMGGLTSYFFGGFPTSTQPSAAEGGAPEAQGLPTATTALAKKKRSRSAINSGAPQPQNLATILSGGNSIKLG